MVTISVYVSFPTVESVVKRIGEVGKVTFGQSRNPEGAFDRARLLGCEWPLTTEASQAGIRLF